MPQLKNALLAILAAALLAEGWYVRRELAELGKTIVSLERQNGDLHRQVQRRKTEWNTQVAADAAAAPSVAKNAEPLPTQLERMLKQARALKAWFKAHPDQQLGEFAYLRDDDWLGAAEHPPTEWGDPEFQRGASRLRESAETDFMQWRLRAALNAYLAASGNVLPADIGQLAPYLDPSVDPSLLQHYTMIATGPLAPVRDLPVIAINPQSGLIDPSSDSYMISVGATSLLTSNQPDPVYSFDKMQAQDAYLIANGGQRPPTPQAMVPYFKNPDFGVRYLRDMLGH